MASSSSSSTSQQVEVQDVVTSNQLTDAMAAQMASMRAEIQQAMTELREQVRAESAAASQQPHVVRQNEKDDSKQQQAEIQRPAAAAQADRRAANTAEQRKQAEQPPIPHVSMHVTGSGSASYSFSPHYHNVPPALASSPRQLPSVRQVAFAVSPPTAPQLLTAPFPVRLLLVRHGESDSNIAPHLIAGQSNHVSLTARGRQQAAALAATLVQRHYHATLVLTSDAVRCQQTLQLLQLHPPPHSQYTSPQLREQSQGQWEGQPRVDVYTADVTAAMRQYTVRFSGPGGESIADTAYRAYAFIMQTITREAPRIVAAGEAGVSVLVVCHGQVIRGLVWLLCGLRDEYVWRMGCDNCSMTELHIDADGVRLVRLNDAAHLQSLVPTSSVSY